MTQSSPVRLGPEPGDVFREYTYSQDDFANPDFPKHFGEADLEGRYAHGEPLKRASRRPRVIENVDLRDAVRAEVAVEYWGGHIGSSRQRFQVNGSDWVDLPQPCNTPTFPEAYHRVLLGADPVDVPLDALHGDSNTFLFDCGPQLIKDFGCGFYWIYSFTLRVYYDPAKKAHVSGAITFPMAGTTLGDRPILSARIDLAPAPVRRVDYIGDYTDFNQEGDGRRQRWHYFLQYGALSGHIGGSETAPFETVWDNEWVPDQDEPFQIMARITDDTGLMTMTPAITGLQIARENRVVRMYEASDMPQAFAVRIGQRMGCKIDVPVYHESISDVRLDFSTWCGGHGDEWGINGAVLGKTLGDTIHHYAIGSVPIAASTIHAGTNTFEVMSNTEHHMVEVNWPGPALKVAYSKQAGF